MRIWWLVGGIADAGLAAYILWHNRRRVSTLTKSIVLAVCGLVALSLVWGTVNSVVIAGRVSPDTSPQARSYRLSTALITDMYTMSNADQLVGNSQSAARADIQAYTQQAADLQGISKHWLLSATGPQPTPAFIAIETNVGNAAYWEADAVTKKAQDVVTPDTGVESEIASDTKTYTSQLLAAGVALKQLAHHYGYTLPTNNSQNG
jgi:hypothetical protein